MEYLQLFVHYFLSVLWSMFRYLIVTAFLMIVTLSVVTGEFPPPFAKTYDRLKSLRASFQLLDQFDEVAHYNNIKDKQIKELERSLDPEAGIQRNLASAAEKNELQLRLETVEAEMMMLRKRLFQAEKQLEQLQKPSEEPDQKL